MSVTRSKSDSGRKPLDIPGRAAAADRNPPLIGVPTGVFDGAWSPLLSIPTLTAC